MNIRNILFLLIFTLINNPAEAGADFDAGMRAYQKGDYVFAKVLFEKALEKNYYDVDARYMYSQILMLEKKYDLAKSQYQIIIKSSPSSQAAKLSQQGLENIEKYKARISEQRAEAERNNTKSFSNCTNKSISSSVGYKNAVGEKKYSAEKDYVKNAYRGGKRYLRPKGMIRVYIPNDSVFNPLMKKAYREWQTAIGSLVMFSFIANAKDASDVVSFEKVAAREAMVKAGNCEYNIEGSSLVGNKIMITAYDVDGSRLPKEAVYHAMLHEIGHSLGIMGHSTNPQDVMSQGADKVLAGLSERDKNTARILYRTYGKEPDAEEIRKAKEAELKDIAKRIPNNSASLIDLGDEFMQRGDYKQALEYYKNAEKITSDINVAFRMVKAYEALKDSDNEIACYKKILEMDSDNETALQNILILYLQQMRFEEGRALLDKYKEKNPKTVNSEQIKKLSEIYSEKNINKMQLMQKYISGKKKI